MLVLLSTGTLQQAVAQQSVLSSGHWYKLSVEKSGVYRINYDLLKKMGFDPRRINHSKIRIFGNEGGMLPQANATARPSDLQENAILVIGANDGKFDTQDFILFYAQGPDKVSFNVKRSIYACESNLYSTKNF